MSNGLKHLHKALHREVVRRQQELAVAADELRRAMRAKHLLRMEQESVEAEERHRRRLKGPIEFGFHRIQALLDQSLSSWVERVGTLGSRQQGAQDALRDARVREATVERLLERRDLHAQRERRGREQRDTDDVAGQVYLQAETRYGAER